MEPGFVKKNWPAGPVQVITRMPRLRVSAPRRAGSLSDGTWIVAASPALPMPMPHTRSRYSVLAAALLRVGHLVHPSLTPAGRQPQNPRHGLSRHRNHHQLRHEDFL
jgi:hypothetical protein